MRNALPILLILTIPLAGRSVAETWLDQGQPAGLIGVWGQEALPISAGGTDAGNAPIRLPKVDRPEIVPVSASASSDFLAAEEEDYYTLDELKAEMKKLAWTKGEFKIVPYGAFWADMVYATERTNSGAYTLYVYSADEQGENDFTIDARRTRFGLDVAGPRIPLFNCAESGGRVEIDFQNSLLSTENKPGVLLRHAYWEVKNSEFKVLVGQTWDLISPLYPNVLNYTVGWDGGNIGYRRTQFRYERYHTVSDRFKWDWEFALAQDITGDIVGDPNDRRESAGWPVLEGRIGCTLGNRPCVEPITLGCSAHVGETGYDFLGPAPGGGPVPLPAADDQRFKTWSVNFDVRVPITPSLGVQGEFFTGANLDSYFGGIGQGVCPCLRVPIRSTGGWFEVWYDLSPRWHTHAGFGIDDPQDNDFLFGRTYNHFVFANLVFDVTKKLNTGIEISSWKTLYQDTRTPPFNTGPTAPGESVTIDWMVKYGF
jgi:hypothetical protein